MGREREISNMGRGREIDGMRKRDQRHGERRRKSLSRAMGVRYRREWVDIFN